MKRIFILSVLLSLSGCDKVSQENYNKLEMGMQYSEVVALLGEPSKCDAVLMAKSCVWGKETKQIDIKFANDQVILFSSSGL